MKFLQSLAAAMLAAALLDVAAAQEVQVAPGETYMHAASGMRFPVQVGDFVRGRIYRYGAADESAGYHLGRAGAEITVTVYVHPSPTLNLTADADPTTLLAARALLCTAQFDALQQEIAAAYEDEVLISAGAAELAPVEAAPLGYLAAYTLTAPTFWGRRNVPVRSDAYLYCFVAGHWSVRYRFTYPAGADVGADIEAFMRDLAWTIAPLDSALTTAPAPTP